MGRASNQRRWQGQEFWGQKGQLAKVFEEEQGQRSSWSRADRAEGQRGTCSNSEQGM